MEKSDESAAEVRRESASFSTNDSRNLHSGHLLIRFAGTLAGIGFWISHGVVGMSVVALLLLKCFDMRIDGTWEVVAPMATMMFGVAVLFAFAGWIARSTH